MNSDSSIESINRLHEQQQNVGDVTTGENPKSYTITTQSSIDGSAYSSQDCLTSDESLNSQTQMQMQMQMARQAQVQTDAGILVSGEGALESSSEQEKIHQQLPKEEHQQPKDGSDAGSDGTGGKVATKLFIGQIPKDVGAAAVVFLASFVVSTCMSRLCDVSVVNNTISQWQLTHIIVFLCCTVFFCRWTSLCWCSCFLNTGRCLISLSSAIKLLTSTKAVPSLSMLIASQHSIVSIICMKRSNCQM